MYNVHNNSGIFLHRINTELTIGQLFLEHLVLLQESADIVLEVTNVVDSLLKHGRLLKLQQKEKTQDKVGRIHVDNFRIEAKR